MKRRVFFWLVAIAIAATAMMAAFYFDESMRHWIALHQSRELHHVMQKVSRFGDWPEHFALGLVLAGTAWWRGNRKWTRIFLSMLLALAIAGLAGRGIKTVTGRARPSVKTEQVWNGPQLSSKYHAFPSGHVAASSAFFAVLTLANWRIGLACLPIPFLIGFSRMYVAAHYLSDVICAAVLGIICGILIARLSIANAENKSAHQSKPAGG